VRFTNLIRIHGSNALKRTALKIIDYTDSRDVAKAVVDLERECNSLKSLRHPSIVRFLDFKHDASVKKAFIQMEWAATELSESDDAVDLADLIHQRCEEQRY
jgi:serine/threonine protein kinase